MKQITDDDFAALCARLRNIRPPCSVDQIVYVLNALPALLDRIEADANRIKELEELANIIPAYLFDDTSGYFEADDDVTVLAQYRDGLLVRHISSAVIVRMLNVFNAARALGGE